MIPAQACVLGRRGGFGPLGQFLFQKPLQKEGVGRLPRHPCERLLLAGPPDADVIVHEAHRGQVRQGASQELFLDPKAQGVLLQGPALAEDGLAVGQGLLGPLEKEFAQSVDESGQGIGLSLPDVVHHFQPFRQRQGAGHPNYEAAGHRLEQARRVVFPVDECHAEDVVVRMAAFPLRIDDEETVTQVLHPEAHLPPICADHGPGKRTAQGQHDEQARKPTDAPDNGDARSDQENQGANEEKGAVPRAHRTTDQDRMAHGRTP